MPATANPSKLASLGESGMDIDDVDRLIGKCKQDLADAQERHELYGGYLGWVDSYRSRLTWLQLLRLRKAGK